MQRKRKQHLLLEQLEERIFLDANPVAALAVEPDAMLLEPETATEPPPAKSAEPAPTSQPREEQGESVKQESDPAISADGVTTDEEQPSQIGQQVDEEEAVEPGGASEEAITAFEGAQIAESLASPEAESDPVVSADGDTTGEKQPSQIGEQADEERAAQPGEVIDPLIGEEFTFTVALENTSGSTLYGPYIDLYFPTAGDDGDGDGLIFDRAEYLGTPVNSSVLTYNGTDPLLHPYAVDSSGNPLEISSLPGGGVLRANDTLVILEMPFGSFTPGQPAAEVEVTAHFSDYAYVDPTGGPAEDQTVYVANGFRFGNDALNNPATDPSQVFERPSQTFRPEVIRFEKDYIGPEQETATGPNYVRTYEIRVDVADGQTVNNLQVIDRLPDSIYFLGNVTGGTLATPLAPGIYSGQDLVIDLGNVLGVTGIDRLVTFDYYVPYLDAAGAPIIARADGSNNDDQPIINDALVRGDWAPLDPDDTQVRVTMDAEVYADGTISSTPANDEEFDAKAIAIQKGVVIADDTGVSGQYNPGDVVAYTLSFQISDYFNFGDMVVTDLLPDGLALLTAADGYAPSYAISDNYGTYSGNWAPGSNLTQTPVAGDDLQLTFDVALVAGYGPSGILRGTLSAADSNNDDGTVGSPATGTITYFARIKEEYISETSGAVDDLFVDQGDLFSNAVTISGNIYTGDPDDPGNLSVGDRESDGSAAAFEIATGNVSKSIFAINGQDPDNFLNSNGQISLQPGDEVTYRLTYQLPTSDFELFRLEDYLPLPVLDVDAQSFQPTIDFNDADSDGQFDLGEQILASVFADAPASGHARLLTSDTFTSYSGGLAPEMIAASGTNSLSFVYGNFHSNNSTPTTIDLVFTVTVSDDPFADGLYLTNQVRAVEGGTPGPLVPDDAIVQIVLDQPELVITKGVVDVLDADDSYGTFTANNSVDSYFFEPGTAGLRFTANGGDMTSTWLAANDIDTNLSAVDAGDTVTFAVVVENTGHFSAFDVTLRDELPTGYTVADITNFSITDGKGQLITYTGNTGTFADFFGAGGIELTGYDKTGDGSTDGDGLGAVDGDAGQNIVIITYDLELAGSVVPSQILTNTATLTNYANYDNADPTDNHVPEGLRDDATVTIAAPQAAKTIIGTGETSTAGNNVVIGETVTYQVTITVPEGTLSNGAAGVLFVDDLDPGLALVSIDSITASAGLSTSITGGFNGVQDAPTVTEEGGRFSLDFGTLTNSTNSNSTPETITITYTTVVLNTAGNQQNTLRNNDVDLQWTANGATQTVSAVAPNVTIQEPQLQVIKEVWNGSAWADSANLDQNDTIDYRITVRHSTTSREDAFDVVFTDSLPTGIDWSGATVSVDSGLTPTSYDADVTDGDFTASWDQLGFTDATTSQATTFIITGGVLRAATAGQVVTNTGSLTWESLASDLTTPKSPYNNNSFERTGDPADPGGAANDYQASDPAIITVTGTVDKLQPDPASYTIGDEVTYSIVVTLPEGATNDLVVTDALVPGMVYVGYSVNTAGFNGTVSATPTVNPASGDGNDVAFSFGDVTVADDNDTTNNSFTLEVTTRVANIIDNQQGTSLPDHASMTYTNPSGGTVTFDDPTDPSITVIEPQITTTKSVVDSNDAGSDAQPGETLTYTILFENTGSSTAYEVNATDDLPDGVSFNAGSATAVDQDGNTVAVSITEPVAGSGNLVIAGNWDIAVDDWVEVQYTVQVLAAGFSAGPHTNLVDADWSSRNETDLNERTYDDTAGYTVDGDLDVAEAGFGVDTTASIGDLVFFDADNSGSFTAGDVGIGGVDVTITADVDGDGEPEFTRTVRTNDDGSYLFSDLPAFDNYVINVNPSTIGGSNPTHLNDRGFQPTFDLNGPATPHTVSGVSLTAGQNRTDVDFGYTGQNSVGDRVWFDVDGDGVQDVGEDGIGNLTVTISADIDGDGSFEYTATDITDGNGIYGFDHLPAGSFFVTVTPPAGSAPTNELSAANGNTDPDLDNNASFTLGADQDRTDIDFGLRGTGSLGDTVWFDTNADGLQAGDATEPGISGVTVTLSGDIDGDGTTDYTATTVTGADGTYSFGNLLGGTYTISIADATLPGGSSNWQQTFDLDEDGSPALDHRASAIVLGGGENRSDIDFGYTGTGALGDRVWNDADGDGVQDAGETGLANVEVTIRADIDGDGTAEYEETARTDASGNYLFTNLPAGDYTVSIATATLPGGMVQTFDLDGLTSSDTAVVTLATGETNTFVDFGYRGTGSIGDRVWSDANGDGIQDPSETGLADVTVTLTGDFNNDGVADTRTTTTDADGNYLFDNLAAGSYTVTTSTLPPGAVPTYDLDGTATANSAEVALAAGQTNQDVDFGYRQTGTIGDRIWLDLDGDGVQDAGELGLNNVDVTLEGDIDGDGIADVSLTTSTDASGNYLFDNLAAGSYTITVDTATLPDGISQTFDPEGAVDNAAVLTLAAGASRLDIDFGYRGTGSIGDRVWSDPNGNGIQDPGETGLADVTVTLSGDFNNDGVTDTRTTTTDADGNYLFANLAAGSYTVTTSTLPPGAVPTFDLDGTATANSAEVALAAGQTNQDVDFGYRQTGTIGDRIWLDLDGDGVQDAGELGLNNVDVTLEGDIDGDGIADVSLTTSTDASGNYLFDNLAAGSYTITVDTATLPDGISQTFDPEGPVDHSAVLTLTAGESRLDIDFGYHGTGSIGDRVWSDANGDGIQDPGETGLAGVTVTLSGDFNSDGVTDTRTTTTDADGNYLFDNLAAGSYTVTTSTLPPGVDPTFDLDGTTTADTAAVTLTAGADRTDVDFGYRQTGTIGDTVWFDTNGNGIQDPGEPGLAGINILLEGDIDGDGMADDSLLTVTDGDGRYSFDQLPAGSYTVTVITATLSAGIAPTFDLDGLASPHTTTVDLGENSANLTADFGYTGTSAIGDTVWFDFNGDGINNPGEVGIPGVQVTLVGDIDLDGTPDTISTLTDSNGRYLFERLPAGDYEITVNPATLPGGIRQTYDPDGVADNGAIIQLPPDTVDLTYDFGYTGTGSVGDTIWNDRDRDGIQDPGEPGIGGVGVSIGIDLNGDRVPDFTTSTTTDAGGQYIFDNLPAGSHIIRIDPATLPPGIRPSFDPDGVLDGTFTVRLGPGENTRDVDFGYAFPPPGQPGGSLTPPPPGPPVEPAGLVIDAFFMHRQFGEEQFPFDRWLEISYPMPPLPVSPIYTGLAEPGTTLVLTIYDSAGNQIGNQTIMADTAGNWLASFPGTLLSELPHDMAIAQQSSLYNSSSPGLFNMRTYFNPNFTSMVHSSAQLDVATIFAYLPSTLMESVHMSNLQSFDIGWDSFKSYEFNTTSINPARTGH
jgi:large repetitive protein